MIAPRKVRIGFEKQAIELPLSALLHIRQIKPSDGCFGKYRALLASIRTLGLVEPLVVYPVGSPRGSYLLLDGHMRVKALREIGADKALCLISTEDDPYTYNDKISGLSLIQEQRMILKAIQGGVTEEDISKALAIDIKTVMSRKQMLEGIHPEAVQILKDKQITERALAVLKQVKSLRQIEMA